MTRVELGGGRGWLEEPAAKSLARVDKQIGHRCQVTEAGRTWDQQMAHYQRYLAGGSIALHPDTPSVHQLGFAIDSDEAQRFVAAMEDHGWRRTVYRGGVLVEPWHFEYSEDLDNHRHEPVTLTQRADGVWTLEGWDEVATPEEISALVEASLRKVLAEQVDMGEYTLLPVKDDGHIYLEKVETGQRVKVSSPYHVSLIMRYRDNDANDVMLDAERAVVRGYFAAVEAAPKA